MIRLRKQVSDLQQKIGLPHIREFAETSSQTTSVSRPSSVARTRFRSVDVRRTFGTGMLGSSGTQHPFWSCPRRSRQGPQCCKGFKSSVVQSPLLVLQTWSPREKGFDIRSPRSAGGRSFKGRCIEVGVREGIPVRIPWCEGRGGVTPRSTETRCRRSYTAAVSQPRQHIGLIMVSSDEEPLVPFSGRSVACTRSTVPAAPQHCWTEEWRASSLEMWRPESMREAETLIPRNGTTVWTLLGAGRLILPGR